MAVVNDSLGTHGWGLRRANRVDLDFQSFIGVVAEQGVANFVGDEERLLEGSPVPFTKYKPVRGDEHRPPPV